jgi:hypothetical protein
MKLVTNAPYGICTNLKCDRVGQPKVVVWYDENYEDEGVINTTQFRRYICTSCEDSYTGKPFVEVTIQPKYKSTMEERERMLLECLSEDIRIKLANEIMGHELGGN